DVGDNAIDIDVTAEDGVSTLTYTVTVERAAPPPSDDATLAALAVSPGTLDPPFDPGTLAYTAAVAHDVEAIEVNATTADAAATLTIASASAASGAPVAVPLEGGDNVIEVVVTAEDGVTTLTYTVTVTRDAPPPSDD